MKNRLNILVPMAGEGSRFKNAGYSIPKPFIKINNKYMIEYAIENTVSDAYDIQYILLIKKDHALLYPQGLEELNKKYNIKFILVEYLTEGSASTTLLAKELINNKDPLFIINCDQFLEWNQNNFYDEIFSKNVDGSIVTINDNRPDFSYAKINENKLVTTTAEKKVISNYATVGYYYWKNGKDYVKSAECMINKNIRTNNEFYTCPVYNEFITEQTKVTIYNVEKMWCLGTPEDLEKFELDYIKCQ